MTNATSLFNNSTLANNTGGGVRSSCNIDHGVLHYFFASSIIVFGLASNGFICVAFAIKRKLRSVTNYFVVNLAVADFLLILCSLVWMVIDSVCAGGRPARICLLTIETMTASASVVGLAMVSFDRYYAVTRALHYNSTMTHRRALIAIICLWIHGFVTALIFLGNLHSEEISVRAKYLKYYTLVLFLVNFLLPFLISIFCYVSIFTIALSHLRHSAPPGQPTDPNSNAAIIFRQLKITFNIVVLAAPFLVTWNFYYGVLVYQQFSGTRVAKNVTTDLIISNLPQLIATINPLIFICLTKDLRRFARQWCRCLLCRDRSKHDRLMVDTYPNSTQFTTSNGEFAASRL